MLSWRKTNTEADERLAQPVAQRDHQQRMKDRSIKPTKPLLVRRLPVSK
jgi:hypothetical protein